MVDAPPTAVGVRPVDRRGSLVVRPRLRTRALGDEFEANCGARSRALDCTGTAALHARRRRVRPATAAAISHPWRNGAAPRGAIRLAVFEFFDPIRIVAFLIAAIFEFFEISCNPYLPPFPARAFHALPPLCPSMESASSTPPAPENYIIRKSATRSHHPAISRCRGGGTSPFHTRSKRPATPRGNA
jgi:hypothetical protein